MVKNVQRVEKSYVDKQVRLQSLALSLSKTSLEFLIDKYILTRSFIYMFLFVVLNDMFFDSSKS